MPDQIENLTYRLLDEQIEPIPRYRLLRDVLQWPEEHLDMIIARDQVQQSRFVGELEQAQLDDGSFGRFMYDQIPLRNALKSTESAVCRAIALGLDREHPVLQKAALYLEGILAGNISWPDKLEDTPGQEVGVKLIAAACLRRIDPQNDLALQETARWHQLLESSFAAGFFDESVYLSSFEEIMGRAADGKTRIAFSRYTLMLMPDILSYQTEKRFVDHIINRHRGLYLVTNHSLHYEPLDFPSRESMRYISALELLAAFPGAVEIMQSAYDWLWEQRKGDGLWDFGPFAKDGIQLPLSASWRRGQRKIDCTVRMLCLLRQMQQTCNLQEKICHEI